MRWHPVQLYCYLFSDSIDCLFVAHALPSVTGSKVRIVQCFKRVVRTTAARSICPPGALGNAAFFGPVEAAGTALGALGTGGLVPTFGGAGLEPTAGGGGFGFDEALTVGLPDEMLPFAPCFTIGTGAGFGTAAGAGLGVGLGLLEAAGIAGILRPAGGGGGGVDLAVGGTSSR